MEKLTKGEKLLWEKIKALEAQILAHTCQQPHVCQLYYYPQQQFLNTLHYHNGSPCYNNPCVWC